MAGSDVQDQDLTELVSESLVLELTDQLLDWKFLGRHLGLVDGNLDEIEENHKGNSKELKYQTLLKWKHKFGKEATIGKLAEALKKVGRTDLADDVMQVHGDTPRCPLLERNGATAPANSQGANVHGDTPRCPLLERNGATAPANSQGANEIQMTFMVGSQSGDESATYVSTRLRSNIGSSDQQWQFEPEELGDQTVEEYELSVLASGIYSKYVGNTIEDVEHFFCVLHTPNGIFDRVQFEYRSASTEVILFRVFRSWHSAYPLTRNKLGEALLKFDKLKKTSLCKLYVDIVKECCQDNSSDSS